MQLFDDTAGEPVVTLDAVNGMVAIRDYVRGDGEASCGAAACPTTDIANYHGTTTTHIISYVMLQIPVETWVCGD